jgi:hypothetical protein
MFGRKICGENAADILERQLKEAGQDAALKQAGDFAGQFAETEKLVIMLIAGGIEFVALSA